jgi:DNA-binding SARP family transcriptional activator/DNA-binding XRE family transcriptional regulator
MAAIPGSPYMRATSHSFKESEIGSSIRRYRQALGITQGQLAHAADLSIGLVRDLEQGRTLSPRWGSLEALASALKLDEHARAKLTASWFRSGGNQQVPRPPARRSLSAEYVAVRILGPLEADRGGTLIDLGSLRRRSILALLALRGDAGVRMRELTEVFWSDNAPVSGNNIVQGHISALRQLLGCRRSLGSRAEPIVWTGSGYQLLVGPHCRLDTADFADLARSGGKAVAGGEPSKACTLYERAMDIWRAAAVADLDCLQEHPSVIDLNRQRSELVARYADAAALSGDHARALPRLHKVCQEEPLNEMLQSRLITALAATGRRTEAVRVFKQLQERLDLDLGIAPSELVWRAYGSVLKP